jgi:DNA replication protein DnaC
MIDTSCTISEQEAKSIDVKKWKYLSPFFSMKRFDGFSLDTADIPQDIKNTIIEYLSNDNLYTKGIGLYLWSKSPGSGKTTVMKIILEEMIKKNYIIYFDSLINIKNKLKEEFNEDSPKHFIKRIKVVDIMALDDVGSETRSAWLDEVLKDIIDDRYNNQKMIFITSNYPLNDLPIDSKCRDRLISMCYPIHFPEKSFRKLGL